MIPNQSKGALGQNRRADFQVSGVAGAGDQRRGSEAVLRDVLEGGAENGFLDGCEGRGRGWVVVGVVGTALMLLLWALELSARLYCLGASAATACAVGARDGAKGTGGCRGPDRG